jgi:hypothetical protein
VQVGEILGSFVEKVGRATKIPAIHGHNIVVDVQHTAATTALNLANDRISIKHCADKSSY